MFINEILILIVNKDKSTFNKIFVVHLCSTLASIDRIK